MLKVTIIYVHNNNRSQTVTCSDGTHGVMRVNNADEAPRYDFNFYGHSHLGFWLTLDQFHDDEEINVKGVLDHDQFQIKFIA